MDVIEHLPPRFSPASVRLQRADLACFVMDEGLTTASELAAELRLDPKHLRRLIREHGLVPSHQHGKRYWLDADDVTRIIQHPAVRNAAGWTGG
jgi:hypothetical protein